MTWKERENRLKQDKALVLYREPDHFHIMEVCADAQIIKSKDLPEVSHSEGFIFHPFSEQEAPVFWFGNALTNSTKPQQTSATQYEHTKFEAYKSEFDKVQQALDNNKASKIVLSRRIIDKTLNRENAIDYFRALEQAYPGAMVFLVNIPGDGIWMGATPEILLSGNEKEFGTMALAGTRWHFPAGEHAWTDKEYEEQAYVSDYVEHFIEKNHLNIIDKQEVHTVKAGNLYHLKTSYLVATPPDGRMLQLAQQMHPTPAVCGIPKRQAQEIIADIESQPREYYSGFLGKINPYKTAMYVNLRSMKLNNRYACLYVGGGITKASDCENEWHETENKAQTLLAVLSNKTF